MCSMASQEMHGSGTRLVNTTDGIQLEIERDAKGSGKVNCHVFVISDSQFNIINNQLESLQYQLGQDTVSRKPALRSIQWQV